MKKPSVEKISTATFRPDSRNGYKDFEIPRADAKRLFEEGKIAIDGTNGGYTFPYKKDQPFSATPDKRVEREVRALAVDPKLSKNRNANPWPGRML